MATNFIFPFVRFQLQTRPWTDNQEAMAKFKYRRILLIAAALLIIFLSHHIARDNEISPLANTARPDVQCSTPLFVAVLNDISNLELLSSSVGLFNNLQQKGCFVQLHILDNTGCYDALSVDDHAGPSLRSRHSTYFDAQQHIQEELQGSHNMSLCNEWSMTQQRMEASATAWTLPVIVTRGLAGTHSFGQSMNWFLLEARRAYRSDVFLWAHTDVVIRDPRILGELLAVSSRMIDVGEPFSYLLTAYDSLCVIHAAAIVRTVGLFDEFMWYFGEIDLMRRAELAGLPMFQWAYGDRVLHHPRSSWRRSGAGSRFQRAINSRVELWRQYYTTRWAQVFGIPDIQRFNVTYLHVKMRCDHGAALPLRRLVDDIGAYLQTPARLMIRSATFGDAGSCSASLPQGHHALSVRDALPVRDALSVIALDNATVSEFTVYLLPLHWSDTIVQKWEANATTLTTFLSVFGIEKVEFIEHLFDQH